MPFCTVPARHSAECLGTLTHVCVCLRSREEWVNGIGYKTLRGQARVWVLALCRVLHSVVRTATAYEQVVMSGHTQVATSLISGWFSIPRCIPFFLEPLLFLVVQKCDTSRKCWEIHNMSHVTKVFLLV